MWQTVLVYGNLRQTEAYFEVYQLLIDLIESYNLNVLSKKIYWETDMEKEEYGLFYDRYTDRCGLSCQNVILSEESL